MAETISVLAGRFGVTSDTLRYYERLGLLRSTARSAAGYRLYDHVAAERLGFIRTAQKVGLRLSDIKELLAIKDQGQCLCGHTDAVVRRRLAEVTAEIAELQALKGQLVALKERNDACLDGRASQWSCAIKSDEGGGAR